MTVDNTDEKEQIVTKASIETSKAPPSVEVPVVVTRAPVYIEDPPFKNVTSTFTSSG